LIRIKIKILIKILIILVKTLIRSLITVRIKIITTREIPIMVRMDSRRTLKRISKEIGIQVLEKIKMKRILKTNISLNLRRKW